jgi:hypothetical protein
MNNPSDNRSDRIRITADEVARVDSGAREDEGSSAFVPTSHAPAPAATTLFPRTWIIAGAVVFFALVALIILVPVMLRPAGGDIDEFARHWRAQQTHELTQSSDVKAYIESTHPLVTFKGATVDSVNVTTRDGSQSAGVNGANVTEIDFMVTYFWSGPVQENGHTKVRHLLDFPSRQMKNSKIIETTALVTIDDESLTQLGMFLIPLLLGGN